MSTTLLRATTLWRTLSGITAFLLGSTTLPAGTYGDWESAKIGGGGYLQNLIFAPSAPGRLYTHVDVGGAFRSDNGGQDWRLITAGLPLQENIYKSRGIDVDPRNADILLYAAGAMWADPVGLFRSTDGGTTWTKSFTAQFYANEDYRWTGNIISRSPANPDIIIVGTAGTGVWRSTNNGASFALVPGTEGINPTEVEFDPVVPNRVWLGAQAWTPPWKDPLAGGFYRSDDNGQTWTKVLDNAPSEIAFLDGKIYGIFLGGGAVRVSTDGIIWNDFTNGLPIWEWAGMDHSVQALEAAGSKLVTATQYGEFFTRAPGDASWTQVTLQSVNKGDWWGTVPADGGWYRYGKGLGDIAVNPADPNNWWFTDWYAAWESKDAGKNWTLRINGIETTVIHTIVQNPSNPNHPFLGMADNGFFYSTDGGKVWTWPPGSFNNAKAIAVFPKDTSRVLGTGTSTGNWLADQVFLSTDGGLTFGTSMSGLPPSDSHVFNSLVVDPVNPNTAYVAASGWNGGVYRTTDGGVSWSPFNTGFYNPTGFFVWSIWDTGQQLAASADGSLVAVGYWTGDPQRYDPVAQTWTSVLTKPSGAIRAVTADERTPGRYFAVSTDGIFRSTDSGKNWTQVYWGSARNIATDKTTANRVVAGTAAGVKLSIDGGINWTDVDAGLPYRMDNVVAFSGNRILAGSGGNGAFYINIPFPAVTPTATHVVATAGNNASLSVTATGAGPFTYQWYFNGVAIAGANGATLSLSGITAAQAGTYWVTVSNATGPTDSAAITVSVNAPLGVPDIHTVTTQNPVLIVWRSVDRADEYVVERADNRAAAFTPIVTLPAAETSFIDTSVAAGRTYFYRVRAKAGGDEAVSKARGTATTDAIVIPFKSSAPHASRGRYSRYHLFDFQTGWLVAKLSLSPGDIPTTIQFADNETVVFNLRVRTNTLYLVSAENVETALGNLSTKKKTNLRVVLNPSLLTADILLDNKLVAREVPAVTGGVLAVDRVVLKATEVDDLTKTKLELYR
ncbi:MAG: immunoglobulin domain-containing protein [Opitutaceae bacterium]|nr:immunoglobulin domain-containing protein [Opitutaceae bacterium]